MATYNDFRKFIDNGINSELIKKNAVHHGRHEDFLRLTSYSNINDFLNNIASIQDLQNLLKNIDAKEFKDFLETQNGFGNTWLKYLIIWYLCDRKTNYPTKLGKIPQLKKKDLEKSLNSIDDFIKTLKSNLISSSKNEQTESNILESKLTDSHSSSQNHFTSNKNKIWLEWPRQIILWGAPGTGKSYTIDEKIHSIDELDQDNIIRVTFHPAMDYSSFVGAYKPVMDGKTIAYKFQPQAFLNAYEKACANSKIPVFLIIEEINRGNCAQIFGDIFQLLDRDDNHESKYPVTPNEDIKKWLLSSQIEDKDRLKLPSNMFIWATMNSSDQSLYKLDSAFQRRWKMFYTPINPGDNDIIIRIDENTTVKWKDFLENINEKIAEECEDRRIGPFFIKGDSNGEISAVDFVGKVLNYLYRAVFSIYNIKCNPRDKKDLSYDSFYNVGVPIFENNIINTSKLKEFFNHIGCDVSDESSNNLKNGNIIDESDSGYEGIYNNEEETNKRSDPNVE